MTKHTASGEGYDIKTPHIILSQEDVAWRRLEGGHYGRRPASSGALCALGRLHVHVNFYLHTHHVWGRLWSSKTIR